MRVLDEATWQERRASLSADETSRAFLLFLETWANDAERYLDWNENERAQIHGGVDQIPVIGPAEALRWVLARTEEERARVRVHFLGQMMAVLAMHWTYGKAMMEGLTPIERRLVEDMTILKIQHEQDKAEQVGPSA